MYDFRNFFFLFIQTKMTMLKGTKLEGITNQNVFLRITTSSAMEKNFNSQLIDFDIKQ